MKGKPMKNIRTILFVALVFCFLSPCAQDSNTTEVVHHPITLANPSIINKDKLLDTILEYSDIGRIAINQQIVTKFVYGGYERPILAGQEYWRRVGDGQDLSKVDAGLLKSSTFYLIPCVLIDIDVANTSWEKAFDWTDGKGNPLKEARFPVEFINDNMKKAAKESMRTIRRDVDFTIENFKILPYGYSELVVDNEDFRATLLTHPPYDTRGNWVPFVDYPITPLATFRGDKISFDKLFKPYTRWINNFIFPAKVMKSNSVIFTLNTVVESGYGQFLTGKADWILFEKWRSDSEAANLHAGPISIGAQDSSGWGTVHPQCWVTRTMVKQVSQCLASHLTGVWWIEFPDPNCKLLYSDEVTDRLMDFLIEKADKSQQKIEDFAYKTLEELREHPVWKDVRPDVFEGIKSDLKTSDDLLAEERQNITFKAIGAENYSKGSYVSKNDFIRDDKGQLTVPKSITLYMFDDSSFIGSETRSLSYTLVSDKVFPIRQYPQFVKYDNVPKIVMNEDGNDFKIDNLDKRYYNVDTEVDSGGGGYIEYYIKSTIEEKNKQLLCNIKYEIYERKNDLEHDSTLFLENSKPFVLIRDMENVILPDNIKLEWEIRDIVHGERHDRFPVDIKLEPDSPFTSIEIKVDHEGRNDLNAAEFHGIIRFDYIKRIKKRYDPHMEEYFEPV